MTPTLSFTAQEQALYSAHLDFFRFVHRLSKKEASKRATETILAKRPKTRWGFSA
jgi:hypothetical protein